MLAQGAPVAADPDQATQSPADDGSAPLGEIIVTAQRREQSIQKVGIAIAAFSGDQLRELNITDSRELAALTPGVHLGGALAGQNSQYTIRGVTQNDFNDIVEAPNAVYLDDGTSRLARGKLSPCSISTASRCSRVRKARFSGATRPVALSTTSLASPSWTPLRASST